MKRDVRVYVEDIWECIARIEEYTKNVAEKDFHKNTLVQDAVLRRLEVIGEASKNVPQGFRERHPDIPWKKMAGMRDVLIHEYFGVNLKRTWKVAMEDIPNLKKKMVKARRHLEEENR